jgi:hypothetical protein
MAAKQYNAEKRSAKHSVILADAGDSDQRIRADPLNLVKQLD